RPSVAAQEIAGDDDLLDLARALVEAEDAHGAVEALDAVVGDIAGAAEHLHRLVGDPADQPGGEVFRTCRFHRDVLAGVALPRGIEHDALCGVGLGLAVGQHALDELELGDLLAELLAPAGIVHALVDQAFGDADADAGNVEPAAVEHLHRDLET